MRFLSGCIAVLVLAPCAASTPPGDAAPELSVYAASSLREVLAELAPRCEAVTGTRLVFNYGASNDLARQIQAAGKADVFFSADGAWMDLLDRNGLVDAVSRRTVLSNHLVVIGASDTLLAINTPADLRNPAIRRLAIANPEGVPAGRYAKEWLVKSGQWDMLRERIVPTIDVRAALAAVTSSGADAAVVYITDARASSQVRILYEVPRAEGPVISYPVAALSKRPFPEAARGVAACFAEPGAAAVYERFGFVFIREPL